MPDTDSIKKPKPGEKSDSQITQIVAMTAGVGNASGLSPMGGGSFGISSPPLYGNGTADNPMGFWGYGSPYLGSYAVYRYMLRNPVIRLARAVVTAALQASSWYFEADADVKPETVTRVEKTYSRLRPKFMGDALRSLDYGWAGFEIVWKMVDENLVVDRFKPLLVDINGILVDDKGNAAGIRPGGFGVGILQIPQVLEKPLPGDLLMSDLKALIVTNDGEAGNLYGRSRLENMRETAWKTWLDCEQQLQATGGKISGKQAIGWCPSGGYEDPSTGKFRLHMDDMKVMATAFKNNQIALGVNCVMNVEDPEMQVKIAGMGLSKFEVIDWGEIATAISGLLERQKHAEELMFMGWLRSPRTGLESQNGSRADAQQHSDTGTLDTQLIGNDIADSLQWVIDADVSMNDGLAAGKIRIRQTPVVDNRADTFKEILIAALADPNVLKTFLEVADMDKVVDGIDIPRDGDWDEASAKVQAQAKQDAADALKQQQQAAGGQTDPMASLTPEEQGIAGKIGGKSAA